MAPPTLAAMFGAFTPGYGLVDGSLLTQLINILFSSEAAIVAAPGGGQTNATQLTARINRVETCATAEDSVKLPPAVPQSVVLVQNATAETLAVFGQEFNPLTGEGDKIAAANSNTLQDSDVGVTQPTTVLAVYVCVKAGEWKQGLMVS